MSSRRTIPRDGTGGANFLVEIGGILKGCPSVRALSSGKTSIRQPVFQGVGRRCCGRAL